MKRSILSLALVALLVPGVVLAGCAPPEPTRQLTGSRAKKPAKKKTTTVDEEEAGDEEEEVEAETVAKPRSKETPEEEVEEVEVEETPEPPPPPPPAETPGQTAFAPVFTALEPTCARCHATGANNAPRFIGATAAATYPLFKERSFQVTGSALLTKGIHGGPAVTASQKATIEKWIAAEK